MSIQSRIVRGVGYGALAVATLGFITPAVTVIAPPIPQIGGGSGHSFQHYSRDKPRLPKINKINDESIIMARMRADDEIVMQLIVNATLSGILD